MQAQASRYKYGHIADHTRIVEHDLASSPIAKLPGLVHYDALAGASGELSYAPLLEQNGDGIPDQLSTSSCVGNAFSTSVFLRAAILGRPIVRPSRKAIYDIARLIDTPHSRITDDGSRPAAAVLGMQQYGLVAESRWPLEGTEEDAFRISAGRQTEWIDVDPPEDVFRHMLDAKVGSYYRIAPGGGCAQAIRQALLSGYIPAFAMPVDQAYEDFNGDGVYAGMMGKSLGGHMQCVVGFGPGYLLVCNSWSKTWGYKGLAPVVDGWFDSTYVTDILVPTVVPGGVS